MPDLNNFDISNLIFLIPILSGIYLLMVLNRDPEEFLENYALNIFLWHLGEKGATLLYTFFGLILILIGFLIPALKFDNFNIPINILDFIYLIPIFLGIYLLITVNRDPDEFLRERAPGIFLCHLGDSGTRILYSCFGLLLIVTGFLIPLLKWESYSFSYNILDFVYLIPVILGIYVLISVNTDTKEFLDNYALNIFLWHLGETGTRILYSFFGILLIIAGALIPVLKFENYRFSYNILDFIYVIPIFLGIYILIVVNINTKEFLENSAPDIFLWHLGEIGTRILYSLFGIFLLFSSFIIYKLIMGNYTISYSILTYIYVIPIFLGIYLLIVININTTEFLENYAINIFLDYLGEFGARVIYSLFAISLLVIGFLIPLFNWQNYILSFNIFNLIYVTPILLGIYLLIIVNKDIETFMENYESIRIFLILGEKGTRVLISSIGILFLLIGLFTFIKPEFRVITRINFSKSGNAVPYQVSGWSVPEVGTWTEGKKAELSIPIKTASSDIIMKVTLSPFIKPGTLDKQRVNIYVNNQKVGNWEITDCQNKEVIISRDYILNKTLNIVFELPDAVSPRELWGVEDNRLLGVAFYSLTLELAK